MDPEQGSQVKLPWFLKMHWQVLLGLYILECIAELLTGFEFRQGVIDVWLLLQAAWLWMERPGSTEFYWIGAYDVGQVVLFASNLPPLEVDLLRIAESVLYIAGVFAMRLHLLQYVRVRSGIELRLSGWLTFFLGPFYFQYKFNEIARTARYVGPIVTPAAE
jgi:hypothetical protein